VCAQGQGFGRSRAGVKSGPKATVRRCQDWERWRRKEEKQELSPGGREMAGRANPARRLWIVNERHALLLVS
jgi:hypothetical protein